MLMTLFFFKLTFWSLLEVSLDGASDVFLFYSMIVMLYGLQTVLISIVDIM